MTNGDLTERIDTELVDECIRAGRKRIESLMKATGLNGVSRRKETRIAIPDERVRPAAIWSSVISITQQQPKSHHGN